MVERATVDSFMLTSSTSVVKFLQVAVNTHIYLPFAKLQLQRVELAGLEMGEVGLDRRRRIGVRAGIDHLEPELLDGLRGFPAVVISGVVEQYDAPVTPVRFIQV